MASPFKFSETLFQDFVNKTTGSKEQIIVNFDKTAAETLENYKKRSASETIQILPIGTDQKPISRNEISLSGLKEVNLADLKIGKVHDGCYVRVSIVSSICIIIGAQCIIEDSRGDVVYLSVYNILPDGLPMLEKYKLGEKRLARGAKIIISEPFLKVMADGTVGIRVDDPEKDLIFDQKISELPQTFSELKAEGNKLFMRKDLDGALHCYNRALSCLVLEDNAAYLLLSNLALCCLKLSEFRQALFFGFAASIVGVASDDQIILLKVYFRCHECLVALKELELAGWFSFQLKTIDNVFWQKNMSKLPSADYSSDSAFNGDTDAIICKVFDIVVPPAISFTEVTQHDELFEGKQAVELKQKGNELLKEANYASAKSSYLAALRRSLHRNAYADILRNISAVYSGLDSPIRSASFALASLCMLPESDKTMFRISRGLLEARCVESAYEFCKAALSKDGENKFF